MTRTYFVDTVFYIALLNPRDGLHVAAKDHLHNHHGNLLTTEYVLVELGNHLAGLGERESFIRFLRRIERDSKTVIISATRDLFDRGADLFEERPDKEWSLTDCISFVVMERHGLTEALTADHHFEQAGFKALM